MLPARPTAAAVEQPAKVLTAERLLPLDHLPVEPGNAECQVSDRTVVQVGRFPLLQASQASKAGQAGRHGGDAEGRFKCGAFPIDCRSPAPRRMGTAEAARSFMVTPIALQ